MRNRDREDKIRHAMRMLLAAPEVVDHDLDAAEDYLLSLADEPEPEPEPSIINWQGPWYPVPNDLIGGWSVMDGSAEPPSVTGTHEVATFTTREAAEHIAMLHNRWAEVQRMVRDGVSWEGWSATPPTGERPA